MPATDDTLKHRGYPPQATTWLCYFCGEEENRLFTWRCRRCGSPRTRGC